MDVLHKRRKYNSYKKVFQLPPSKRIPNGTMLNRQKAYFILLILFYINLKLQHILTCSMNNSILNNCQLIVKKILYQTKVTLIRSAGIDSNTFNNLRIFFSCKSSILTFSFTFFSRLIEKLLNTNIKDRYKLLQFLLKS